jgi:hypothetical protein
MIVGQVVGGSNERITIREKKGVDLELGDLLVVEEGAKIYIYLVSELEYGSLVEESRLMTSAGSMLEGVKPNVEIPEKDLRLYRQIGLKPLLEARSSPCGPEATTPRSIPAFFSMVREIQEEDFKFLRKPRTEVLLGKLRSGTKVLDFDYFVNGEELFSHHALISAQTGRGKSNLVKVMLWEMMKHNKFGVLVLDVHNEYFGLGNNRGLRSHPNAGRSLVYYSRKPPPGQKTLTINLKKLYPQDLEGILYLSDAQQQALELYQRENQENWIESLLTEDVEREKEYERKGVGQNTIRSLRRKIGNLFRIRTSKDLDRPYCQDPVFDLETRGESTISDIAEALEQGKIVLIDGSCISDDTGLIIAGSVMREIFGRYEAYRDEGILDGKPQIGVVLEEAPRILGETYGKNVFGRIAREGRKFKIGLLAVTQMVSVIPDDILANIGTKIIMGNEMAMERRKLMDSASQDLTGYDQLIAGLDKGEAIVSSIFSKFPVPIHIPLFEDVVAKIAPGNAGEDRKRSEQVYF